jgi:hypothetical protein
VCHHQKLSQSDRQGLQTVAVAKVSQYPKLEQVYVHTMTQSWMGALGGVAGAASIGGFIGERS